MGVIHPDQFLGLAPCEMEKANAIILPLPFERTVSYGDGTWRAPRAILDASCQVETFDEETLVDFEEHPLIHTAPAILDDNDANVEEYLALIRDHVAGFPRRQSGNPFVLSLGGEHTVTYGVLLGLSEKPADVTVVQVDAHADLANVLDGKTWSHGTVMRRLREQGVRLVQIGVRSLSREEYNFAMKDEGVDTFFAHHIPERWDDVRETLRQLEGEVYLSVDVDGFDPAVIPNTGAPQPNGLSWNQVMDIIREISASRRSQFLGADVVEYVASPHPPGYDIIAAKLVVKILSYWFSGKEKQSSAAMP